MKGKLQQPQTPAAGGTDPLSPFYCTNDVSVTTALLVINAALFGAMVACSSWVTLFEPKPDLLINWGANYGVRSLDAEPWRLFSNIFVHAGLAHLGVNLYVLWDAGRTIERLMGKVHYLCLYILSGITGSLLSLFFNGDSISTGASGSVFGVFGALLSFFLLKRHELPVSVMRYGAGAAFLVSLALMYGFLMGGVDNAAHLGGLIAGAVMGAVFFGKAQEDAHFKHWGATSLAIFCLALFMFGRCKLYTSVDFAIARGKEAGRANNWERALGIFNDSVNHSPGSAAAYAARATAFRKLHRWKEAIADFTHGLKIEPNNLAMLEGRASCLLADKNYGDAIADARRSLEIDQKSALSHVVLARAYSRMGDFEKSQAEYAVARQLQPRVINTVLMQASDYAWHGKFEQAKTLYDKAVSMDKTDPEPLRARAVFAYSQGDFQSVLNDSYHALKLSGLKNDGAPYSILMIALAHGAMGQEDQELQALQTGLERLDKSAWPIPVMKYLAGQIQETDMLIEAVDHDKLTEAKAYAGLRLAGKDPTAARERLKWVVDFGNQDFVEYQIARTLLLRSSILQ